MVKCTEECAAATAAAADSVIVPAGEPLGGGVGGGGGSSVYGGFRLCGGGDAGSAGERAERESGTSASVYSFYKQRIDAMFDETRSQISMNGGGRQTLYHRLESEEEKRQRKINNSVQARIERMFVEMAGGTEGRGVAGGGRGMRFSVDYLGSVGLRDKVTSLQGLQLPLADLYFAYCRLREAGTTGECLPANGTLEISGSGLKVHHGGGPDQTELEQLNPFPTIAVWAAVKFVSRARASDGAPEFAFLPLIADPDAVDKGALFRPLAAADRRAVAAAAAAAGSTPGAGDPSCAHHAPLLAVVMRKLGVSKQLECHGFVCARSEDAVVIAANLYQALMAFMQARQRTKHAPGGAKTGPKNRNGISYVSVASSSVAGDPAPSPPDHPPLLRPLKPRLPNPKDSQPSSVVAKCDFPDDKDSLPLPKRQPSVPKIPPPVPVRPPRRKTKSSASSTSEDGEEPIVIQQGVLKDTAATGQQPERHQQQQLQSSRARHSRSESEPCAGAVAEQLHKAGGGGGLKQHQAVRRTASDLHSYAGGVSSFPQMPFSDAPDGGGGGGDILTKVAIPRSRSFLNAGGPLTRYGRRQSMGPGYGAGNGFGGGGNGSPLGFKELFAEFRVQEGLNSMDDILGAIIDAEGMSFNDLKPIYKEFLLKLAVTLTKDELYQRSKSIMRRQRKKNRRKGAGCVNRKKSFTSGGGGGGGIKRVFRRSVGKLKQSKPRPQSFEFTSVLFPSSVPLRASKKIRGGGFSVESSTTSTSSYSARNFHLRGGGGMPTRRMSGGGGGGSSQAKRRGAPSRRRPQPPSASEDSDFFSLAHGGGTRRTAHTSATAATNTLAPHNRSSSGYFSCSECSYDSESCTCTSADKCYCSQGEGKRRAAAAKEEDERERTASLHHPHTLSSCGCDTDSCLDSDKCYCTASANGPSLPHHHHRRTATATASVFDQLKQRGFPVSDATSPHRHRRRQAPAPPLGGVRPAKSMELLGAATGASSTRTAALQTRRTRSDETGGVGVTGVFGRRMDVYAAQPPRAVSRRSHSSDNLVVDYDLFTTSSRSEAEDAVEAAAAAQSDAVGRVLVVSARDPRGRIVCMGASCRSDAGRGARAPLPGGAGTTTASASVAPMGVGDGSGAASSRNLRRSRRAAAAAAASASEALSVKKSAEIAAVFSDMKVQAAAAASAATAADEVRVEAFASSKDMFYNGGVPFQQSNDYYFASRASVKSYLGSSLENSLGYLP